MKRRPVIALALGLSMAALGAAGCSPAETSSAPPAAIGRDVPPCNVSQPGPDGQAPTAASSLALSPEEITKFKAVNRRLRVATFWQAPAVNNTLMVQGMQAAWKEHGLDIEIVSQSNANFDAPTQASQIETQLALKPDAMVGILVDAASERTAIQKVNAAGIPIIFWDMSAGGATSYTSIVTSNGQQAGCLAADAMAKALGGRGDLAVLPMAFAFYPTDQRVKGFEDRIKTQYPDMHVVAKMGATVEKDGITKGQGLLQRYPTVKGVFASWVDPAMGVLQAIRTLGRNDVVVTTVDLAEQNAKIIASCGPLKAAATQLPYEEGVAEGRLLVKALLGAEVPKYVVTDTPIATHENVLDVYQAVYHRAAPSEVADAYVKSCQ